tara:strand:- start:483 stop:1505 length:1023 start_codon:yes stop_codon:yes gene_type:complete
MTGAELLPPPKSRKINTAYQRFLNKMMPFDNKEYQGGELLDMSIPNPDEDTAFQDFMLRQRMAAGIDGDFTQGQSTATGYTMSPAAQEMLKSAGLTDDQYFDAVKKLGVSLDEPRFGSFSGMPVLQGLDYLSDMDQRRAYEQLTGSYQPSGIAKMLGIANSDTARYVPVMEGGQVVGSLSVDADGKPLSYTGSRSDTAKVMDPTIDQVAAMAKIGARPERDPNVDLFGNRFNKSDDGPGISQPGPAVAAVGGAAPFGNPCPVGYMMDPATNACVIDPNDVFNRPEIQTPAMPAASYTAAGAYTMPTLAPPVQPNFVVPTPNIQPITVAQQGLASLPFRTS